MEAEEMVPPLERISSLAIIVQASGPSDEKRDRRFVRVVESLDQVSPPSELVDLVQNNNSLPSGKLLPQQNLSYPKIVP
jgi:hypothetical protein